MRICVVASHGGHLAIAMEFFDAFKGEDVFVVTYKSRIERRQLKHIYLIEHYGERLGMIPTLISVVVKAFVFLLKVRPKVIFTTGAEIAIPFCYLGRVFGAKVIYFEFAPKVSITGWLVYPISNVFLVNWRNIKKFGSRVIFLGSII